MQVGTYSDSNDGIALSVVQVESDQAQCLVTSHCEVLCTYIWPPVEICLFPVQMGCKVGVGGRLLLLTKSYSMFTALDTR